MHINVFSLKTPGVRAQTGLALSHVLEAVREFDGASNRTQYAALQRRRVCSTLRCDQSPSGAAIRVITDMIKLLKSSARAVSSAQGLRPCDGCH